MQFAPEEGAAFFRDADWKVAEFRESREEAHRLKREMPFGWLLQLLVPSSQKVISQPLVREVVSSCSHVSRRLCPLSSGDVRYILGLMATTTVFFPFF